MNTTAEDCFRKALLLAAASSFEVRVSAAILDFVADVAGGSEEVVEFARIKRIARQYHTLFDWDRSNANRFFGHFGDGLRATIQERVSTDADLDAAVKAFLEVGRERNRVVHQDYGSVALEKTADEIYQLYRTADRFVNELPNLLRARLTRPANDRTNAA